MFTIYFHLYGDDMIDGAEERTGLPRSECKRILERFAMLVDGVNLIGGVLIGHYLF